MTDTARDRLVADLAQVDEAAMHFAHIADIRALIAERDTLAAEVGEISVQRDHVMRVADGYKARAERAEAKVAAVEALCDEADRNALASISRMFNGEPFPDIVRVQEIRAALADTGGDA